MIKNRGFTPARSEAGWADRGSNHSFPAAAGRCAFCIVPMLLLEVRSPCRFGGEAGPTSASPADAAALSCAFLELISSLRGPVESWEASWLCCIFLGLCKRTIGRPVADALLLLSRLLCEGTDLIGLLVAAWLEAAGADIELPWPLAVARSSVFMPAECLTLPAWLLCCCCCCFLTFAPCKSRLAASLGAACLTLTAACLCCADDACVGLSAGIIHPESSGVAMEDFCVPDASAWLRVLPSASTRSLLGVVSGCPGAALLVIAAADAASAAPQRTTQRGAEWPSRSSCSVQRTAPGLIGAQWMLSVLVAPGSSLRWPSSSAPKTWKPRPPGNCCRDTTCVGRWNFFVCLAQA